MANLNEAPSWPKVLTATQTMQACRRAGDARGEAQAKQERADAMAACEAELAEVSNRAQVVEVTPTEAATVVVPGPVPMAPGTYHDGDQYVAPTDENWSAEGYEAVTGQPVATEASGELDTKPLKVPKTKTSAKKTSSKKPKAKAKAPAKPKAKAPAKPRASKASKASKIKSKLKKKK